MAIGRSLYREGVDGDRFVFPRPTSWPAFTSGDYHVLVFVVGRHRLFPFARLAFVSAGFVVPRLALALCARGGTAGPCGGSPIGAPVESSPLNKRYCTMAKPLLFIAALLPFASLFVARDVVKDLP